VWVWPPPLGSRGPSMAVWSASTLNPVANHYQIWLHVSRLRRAALAWLLAVVYGLLLRPSLRCWGEFHSLACSEHWSCGLPRAVESGSEQAVTKSAFRKCTFRGLAVCWGISAARPLRDQRAPANPPDTRTCEFAGNPVDVQLLAWAATVS